MQGREPRFRVNPMTKINKTDSPVNYYAGLSQTKGYQVKIPEVKLTNISFELIRRYFYGKAEELLEISSSVNWL